MLMIATDTAVEVATLLFPEKMRDGGGGGVGQGYGEEVQEEKAVPDEQEAH